MAELPDRHDGVEDGLNLLLALFWHEWQDEADVLGVQGLARGDDDGSIHGIAVRRHDALLQRAHFPQRYERWYTG